MAKLITDYCTTDDVRSVLGTNDEEITDSVILSIGYSVNLQERLYDLSPTIEAYFETLTAIATPTANQQRLIDLIKSFASYVTAQALIGTGPLAMPKSIEDSKAKMTRIDDPFKDVREAIAGMLAYLSTKILALYASLVPGGTVQATVTPVYFQAVGIATDPVTNT